ncbi:MAG: GNAT family N-acetyltransferase [Acholeplasma sp.]
MQIRKVQSEDIKHLLDLFNQTTLTPNFLYEKLSEEDFKAKFIHSTNVYDIHTFVATYHQSVIGFISGVYDITTKKAYITMIIVDTKYRHKKIGTALLNTLETVLRQQLLDQDKVEIVFFNPVALSWVIPHTHAIHPNAPGIDSLSDAYLFFKAHNYLDFAVQNAYYMDIRNYAFSQLTQSVIDSVENKGFKFGYYDLEIDYGLETLLDNLGSPVWKTVILEHIHTQGNNNTLLVPTFEHKVAGFTGPLKVEPNGRGYFAGIGTHSDYRGFGLGKALFAKLVMGLKVLGADYMTLFTGEHNPARRMYEKEGFKVVRTFIDLRKVDFK